MIFSSGGGIVIGFAIFVSFFLGQEITGGFEDDAPNYITTWGASLGLGIAAAINWALLWLSGFQKGRVIIDKETGIEEVLGPSHSLFFIPLRFWIPICFALSLWWLVLGFVQRADSENPAEQAGDLKPNPAVSRLTSLT